MSSFSIGSSGGYLQLHVARYIGTLDTYEYPSGTITFNNNGGTTGFYCGAGSNQTNLYTLFLGDANKNKYCELSPDITLKGTQRSTNQTFTYTANSNCRGAALYLFCEEYYNSNPQSLNFQNYSSITISTSIYYTNCTAPTSVSLVQDGNGKLKVSWSGASNGTNNNISNYTVYLSTSSGGSAATGLSATTTATSYTFTVNNTTTYYAAVRSNATYNSSGYKWSSGQAASYYTNCTAPTSVTLVQDGNGKLKVSWSGASGGINNAISSYTVYLSTSSGGSAATGLSATTTSSSYTFTVNNTTTYYAAVRSNAPHNNSGYKWSSGQAAYYYTSCSPPNNINVSRSKGNITISWLNGGGGTNNSFSNFNIIRNTSASENDATNIISVTTRSTTDSNVPAGTYYYGVKTHGSVTGYDSAYVWSSSITVPAKPTISVNDFITKTQMDSLKSWLNDSSLTNATQYDIITATLGNSYYNNNLDTGTTILKSWYDNAT